jgi:hypothetical protein
MKFQILNFACYYWTTDESRSKEMVIYPNISFNTFIVSAFSGKKKIGVSDKGTGKIF